MKNENMKKTYNSLGLRHILYPKCPYNDSVIVFVLRLCLIAIGTSGLYILNFWIALVYLIYSFWFNIFVWPIKHCKYCYYKVKEITINTNTGKKNMTLLQKDAWIKKNFEKHVNCAKKWFFHSYILWLGPILLIPISFFLDFSVYALVFLIGFLLVLTGTLLFVKYIVCPTCAFIDECHTAF